MKKVLAMLTLLLMFLVLFVSCDSSKEEKLGLSEGKDGKLYLTLPDGDSVQTIPVTRMDAADAEKYSIVRSETDNDSAAALVIVYNGIKDTFPGISVQTDWIKRGEEVPVGTSEILVGETNRPESPEINSLRYDDYVIRYENGRFVICGGSHEATEFAAGLFCEYFTEPETRTMLVPDSVGFVHTGKYPCDSITINGISLGDFAVRNQSAASADTLSPIGTYYLNMTGWSPENEPTHTVTVRKTENETLCTAEQDASGNIVLSVGKDENTDFAVRYFLYELQNHCPVDPAKTGQKMEMMFTEPLTIEKEDILKMKPIELYVAPGGNDENPGTEKEPLATMNGAKLRVREKLLCNLAPITVYFREGDYFFTESVEFDSSDSGNAATPVSYCAYPGETDSFIGGVKVDASLIKKAESVDILDRISDTGIREKLMQIDLSGITDEIPDIYSYGHAYPDSSLAMEIYVNDTALKRSQWPNDTAGSKYLLTSTKAVRVNDDGTKTIFYDKETAEHVNRWSEKSLSDLYIFGFLYQDWTNETYDANGINRSENSITLKGGLQYFHGISSGKRFYFFNLPEEIDTPNESYIDRKARIAYFLPGEDFSADSVYLSMLSDYMLKFSDTDHIRIENIKFSYTRNAAILAEGADDFVLNGCTVSHTSEKALRFVGCSRVQICNCNIWDCANGGIDISGGDRVTLTSSESVIENCMIHDINRDGSTYAPGISASAVGLVIRNNHLYHSVHQMIQINTNDVVIEGNEFDHCVTEAGDMGAIYYGRNPSIMGTIIRGNYFHDMGSDYGGDGQFSIYIDDGSTGADIYDNLFCRAAGTPVAGARGQAAIMQNGAQFSHIHNNVFIDTQIGMRYGNWTSMKDASVQDSWYRWLYDRFASDGFSIIEKCQKADFDSPVWHEKYDGTIWGQLYAYFNNELISEYFAVSDEDLAKIALEKGSNETNEIENNVFVKVTHPHYEGPCNMHNNFISQDISIFCDYDKENYSLTEDGLAKIREAAPTFEIPDFSGVGFGK